jgi:hypothetical protein
LHLLVVELALDAQPFLPQPAAGQAECEYPEWLGGFPGTGGKQCPGGKV